MGIFYASIAVLIVILLNTKFIAHSPLLLASALSGAHICSSRWFIDWSGIRQFSASYFSHVNYHYDCDWPCIYQAHRDCQLTQDPGIIRQLASEWAAGEHNVDEFDEIR